MKRTITIFSALLLGTIIGSCDQKEVQDTSSESLETIQETEENHSFLEEYPNAKKMKEIDMRIDPENRVESLYWEKQSKNGSEFTQVVAYLNEDGLPMKITEHFVDGNYQPEGRRHYYLDENKLIAFSEESNQWIDSLNTNYSEKRTIYNAAEPVISQVRYADSYDEIEDVQWKNIRAEHHSLKKVNKILSGVEEFQPHFISVIKTDQLFLLLGEAKPQTEERYTTAVRVDEMTPFIKDLLENLDKYKFRPVEIAFEVVGGNNTPEYRVLTNIAWKE
ncbi:hypothetical protein [Brumimicrobium oceani]|uniref:Uncharacterized protein n=1 Tax=Brumimicrobium oceani TaxID=2100725 RepID=A0A2U2XCD5_9FLAO|nr:hypothetical protein [Brumimicrobium oceani]PWH85438.1 hypothetical protein DIT68_09275 [Brumimicrobium oceani]